MPTLRAVLTNLINLGGGGVPILGGAADGDEAEGEAGAAAADAAISRASGFVEELDALLAAAAARWRRVFHLPRAAATRRRAADGRRSRCASSVLAPLPPAVHAGWSRRDALPGVHGSDGQLVRDLDSPHLTAPKPIEVARRRGLFCGRF